MSRPVGPRSTRVTAHSAALICKDTDIRGEVTIGEGTIVHPKAAILAMGGPIVIGKNCVVEEMAVILNRRKEVMIIGDENHFMVGCRVESPSIGDTNTFQPRSQAGSAVHISHHCTLAAGTVLLPSTTTADEESLPPYTVISGENSSRRQWEPSTQVTEEALREKHIEYLRDIMPKYNRMRVT